jgi:hypothetical protein
MSLDRKLLDLAQGAPCALLLGVPGCGNHPSVPAHSDMLRHGRGVGHKSHPIFAVAGCPACHAAFTRANLGRDGYEAAWLAAHERYLVWLFDSGKLRLASAGA